MSKEATVAHISGNKVKCLRVQGIGEADITRLAAFLRIGSDGLQYRWQISAEGHFDVLLIGDEETVPMFDDSFFTMRLVDSRCFDGEPGQICKPLAFEPLVEQLKIAENMPPRPVAEPMAASMPQPEDVTEPVDWSRSPGELYRLDRLPAVSALGNDRRVLTVVSLLTLRAVQFDELMALSGLSTVDCEAALVRLKSLGVLHVIVPAPVRERVRSRSGAARSGKESEPGVIARLRDRLGLGGH